MSILFINGSPEKDGNTARIAHTLLEGHKFQEYDLVDHKIYDYGQRFADDEFDELLHAFRAADTIVIGSPVYWHDLSGMLRNMLDRFYGPVEEGSMAGKRLFFIFQGAAPTEEMLHRGEFTMSRFASLYGMDYMGMATNDSGASALAEKI